MEKGKELIVQSNKIVEASYRLSVQEKRMIYVLLSSINKNDEDFKKYEFTISEIAEYLELSKERMYQELKFLTKDLMSKVLSLNEKTGLLQINWFSSVKYIDKQGKIIIKFAPELKPYLLQLKENFTKLNKSIVLSLNSIYSMRIYELMKQYENIGHRELTLENLRKILSTEEQKSYEIYNRFKAKVLLIAEKEINEKSDINISFTEIKSSRKVIAIKFYINKKDVTTKDSKTDNTNIFKEQKKNEVNTKEIDELLSLIPLSEPIKLWKSKLLTALKKHSFEIIRADLLYCKEKKPKDLLSYFETSLLKGHYSTYSEEKKKDKDEKKRVVEELKKEQELLEGKETEKIDKIVDAKYNSLSEDDKKFYMEKYSAQNEIIRRAVNFEMFVKDRIKQMYL